MIQTQSGFKQKLTMNDIRVNSVMNDGRINTVTSPITVY